VSNIKQIVTSNTMAFTIYNFRVSPFVTTNLCVFEIFLTSLTGVQRRRRGELKTFLNTTSNSKRSQNEMGQSSLWWPQFFQH